IAVAAFGPLYFAAYPEREGYTYLLTLAIVLIFKVWNLIANWWMLKIRDKGTRQWDHIVRLAVNISVFYFLIEGSMLLAAITTVLFIALFLYDLNRSRKEAGIKWDLLVEKDQQRMQTFYRFANLFTDVPRLKNRVKKRYWLVSFVDKLPFKQQLTYDYLYRITFIRSGDYLGMYVRLIVIGGLFIYYVPNIWMKLLFALLFLYMSSFQMVTLYNHHRTVVWLDLYPVKRDLRQKALMKWLLHLAIIQTVVFSLVFIVAGNYMGSILTIVGGTVFDFLFIYGYVKKKLLHK